MSFNVRGDFAKLANLQRKIKSLASDDRRLQLANVIGAAALAEVQLGFRESRDPYGRTWAPLLLRSGGKPLLDTGRFRSSYSYQPGVRGFKIGTNFIGAKVHQYGATITPKRARFLRFQGKIQGRRRRTTGWLFAKQVTIPRRQMVPEGRLGPRWSKVFHDTGHRFLSRIMKA